MLTRGLTRYPESPGIGHLVSRSLLCPFIAYHHDKKTPIHLLIAGLTMSIRSLPSRQEDAHTSSCRRSNYEWISSTQVQRPCMSSSLPSRLESIRLTHRAQHATQSHPAQVSNPMTMHVL